MTAKALDYEVQVWPKKLLYTIEVESTDSGSPALSIKKTFTIEVLNVNERPTAIRISNSQVW